MNSIVKAQKEYLETVNKLLKDSKFNIVGLEIKENHSVTTFEGDRKFLSKFSGLEIEDVVEPRERKLTVFFSERNYKK